MGGNPVAGNEEDDDLPDDLLEYTISSTPPARETAWLDEVVCEKCGFGTGMRMGSSEDGATFHGIKLTCGRCGHVTEAGGTHEIARVDGHLRVVFHDMTPAELKRLRDAIRDAAAASGATVEDVLAEVEKASPGFAEWIRTWMSSQGNRLELWAVLPIILAVIGLAMTNQQPSQTTNINQAIISIENGEMHDLPLPRQKPCFCLSGKRYNQCHGHIGASAGEAVHPPDTGSAGG